MNYLSNNCFRYLLFVLLICCYTNNVSAQKDYIVQKGGMKIYGEILNSSPALFSTQIRFKTENSIVKTLYPKNITSWKRGNRIYESKLYRHTKKKSYQVFMELKSGAEGPVKLLEFYNTYGDYGFTQTFLERDGKLTEFNDFAYRKQMKVYLKDEPQAVEAIQKGRFRKKDLDKLIAFYNDLKTDDATIVAEDNSRELIPNEEEEQEEEDDAAWNIDDLLLSMEAAEKKYMDMMTASTQDIKDEEVRKIVINHRIGRNFFEQLQYEKAAPYLQKALKYIEKTKQRKDIQAPVLLMLTQLYANQDKQLVSMYYNQQLLAFMRTEKVPTSTAFEAYLNWGKLLKEIEPEVPTEQWNSTTLESEQIDWESYLGDAVIAHPIRIDKKEHYNLCLIAFQNAQKQLRSKDLDQYIELDLSKGALFFEVGLYNKSLSFYKKAVLNMNALYGEDYPPIAQTKRKISEIYLAAQLYTEALEYINQAEKANSKEAIKIDDTLLENINKVAFPFELLYSITTKAIVEYKQLGASASEEQLKKMLAHYAIATQLLHQLRNTYKKEGGQYRLANVTHRFSQHAVLICNDLYTRTQKEEYLEEAFHYAELSKSAVLFETMHDLKSKKVSGIPQEQIVYENGLKSKIAYLKSEIYYEQQKGKYKNITKIRTLEAFVEKTKSEHQQLLDKFKKEYPEYFQLKYDYKGISLEKLQSELNPNEVFLEYVATDSFIFVLAIDQSSVKHHFQPLKEKLSVRIKRMQYILKKNKADLFVKHGPALYNDIIAGVEDFIRGKNLIIAPDAELNYLPFGVLPTKASKFDSNTKNLYASTHFLIQNHAICYNYSASIYWHNKHQNKNTATKKIATWAPQFDNMNTIVKEKGMSISLSELPGAQKEAVDIADMFNSQSFINEQASEHQFKLNAADYCVLHIATHGILNDKDPLFSNLILCNQEREDGILHAFELYSMQLKANLAVLSACNSGMGKLTKGEGVVSIARGFSYAGVPNIIMSKWPVSDWSTQHLMRAFYNKLKAGKAIDQALQEAKVEFIENNRNNETVLAPFYWGGFVLTGANQSIDILIESNSYLYWWMALSAILVVGLILFIYTKKKRT